MPRIRFGVATPPLTLCAVIFCHCVVPAVRGQQVKQAEFRADSVARTLSYYVSLPAGYERASERYPVLYMLHGFSGNFTQWRRFGAADRAKNYPLIVVMPDGGNSWWINWAASDAGQTNQWEDFVVRDLIAHVDATYRTVSAREGRAICGLSMGGYGALVVGLRNPDLFCAIGSQSGALGFARQAADRLARGESLRPATPPSTKPDPRVATAGFSSQAERTPRGDPFVTAEDCAKCDPYQLVLAVRREKLPHIYLDCGTEDTFLPQTREFVDVLLRHDIPFTYSQSAGGHEGDYWRGAVSQAVAVQFAVIERNLEAQARARK